MAVVKVPQSSTLTIKVQTGVNAAGSPVYKNLRFGSVKPSAADADIFAVGQALGGMQTYVINAITRDDSGELMNQ